MMVDAAREISQQIAQLPRPGWQDADPIHTAELVEAAVARQLELLRPHIKGEPGARGMGIDDLVLEHTKVGVATLVVVRGDARRVVGGITGLRTTAGCTSAARRSARARM
jgi:hypothetical protein